MKATIPRKELAEATKAAGKFLPRLHHISSLAHYLVEAHSGIVAITATDLEAGRRVEVEADVETEGDVLVPGALSQIVASGLGDEVSLSATDENLTVKTGRTTNRLRLGVREDYPDAEPEMGDADEIKVESWHKVQAVSRMAGTDKNRPITTGVYLDGTEAIATDSHRLGYVTLTDREDHPNALVPARAIQALDANVTALQIDGRHVKARTEDGAWWCRQIEGAFPKWRNLLAQQEDSAVAVTLTSEVIKGVLSRCRHIDQSHVPVRFTIGDGEVRVQVFHKEIGEFDETLEVKTEWSGKPEELTTAFNSAYLRSMVEPVETVTLGIVDGIRPATVEGDDWWHAMLMPVRL